MRDRSLPNLDAPHLTSFFYRLLTTDTLGPLWLSSYHNDRFADGMFVRCRPGLYTLCDDS